MSPLHIEGGEWPADRLCDPKKLAVMCMYSHWKNTSYR